MRKFFTRLIAMIVVLGAIGFIAFAYVGDLSPERSQTRTPVALELQ